MKQTEQTNGEEYTALEIKAECIKFNLEEADFNLSNCMARLKQKENFKELE